MFTDDTASNVDAINHEGLSVLSYLAEHEFVQDTLTAQCCDELVRRS